MMQTIIALVTTLLLLVCAAISVKASLELAQENERAAFFSGVLLTFVILALAYFTAWLGGI